MTAREVQSPAQLSEWINDAQERLNDAWETIRGHSGDVFNLEASLKKLDRWTTVNSVLMALSATIVMACHFTLTWRLNDQEDNTIRNEYRIGHVENQMQALILQLNKVVEEEKSARLPTRAELGPNRPADRFSSVLFGTGYFTESRDVVDTVRKSGRAVTLKGSISDGAYYFQEAKDANGVEKSYHLICPNEGLAKRLVACGAWDRGRKPVPVHTVTGLYLDDKAHDTRYLIVTDFKE